MQTFDIILNCMAAFLNILTLLMTLRAIMSWLPISEGNGFMNFLVLVTEPAVIPVRRLSERFGWFEDLPIDVSFFIAYIVISLFGSFIAMV